MQHWGLQLASRAPRISHSGVSALRSAAKHDTQHIELTAQIPLHHKHIQQYFVQEQACLSLYETLILLVPSQLKNVLENNKFLSIAEGSVA